SSWLRPPVCPWADLTRKAVAVHRSDRECCRREPARQRLRHRAGGGGGPDAPWAAGSAGANTVTRGTATSCFCVGLPSVRSASPRTKASAPIGLVTSLRRLR